MFIAPSNFRASRSLAYNPTGKGIPEQAWRLNIDSAMVCKYFSKACSEFFINVYARRKNELKIMIVIFKNLLAYPTLVVWSLITMLNIGLIFL